MGVSTLKSFPLHPKPPFRAKLPSHFLAINKYGGQEASVCGNSPLLKLTQNHKRIRLNKGKCILMNKTGSTRYLRNLLGVGMCGLISRGLTYNDF